MKIKITYWPNYMKQGLGNSITRLDTQQESDFSLYFGELKLSFEGMISKKKVYLYKVFILPHITKVAIDELVKALGDLR